MSTGTFFYKLPTVISKILQPKNDKIMMSLDGERFLKEVTHLNFQNIWPELKIYVPLPYYIQ